MKNVIPYSHLEFAVLYTAERGNGRAQSRGVRLERLSLCRGTSKLKGRWESAPVNGVK